MEQRRWCCREEKTRRCECVSVSRGIKKEILEPLLLLDTGGQNWAAVDRAVGDGSGLLVGFAARGPMIESFFSRLLISDRNRTVMPGRFGSQIEGKTSNI